MRPVNKLYVEDMNNMTCGNPECTNDHKEGLIVNSACHTKEPTTAWYSKGILTIKCSICESVVAEIAVASIVNQN